MYWHARFLTVCCYFTFRENLHGVPICGTVRILKLLLLLHNDAKYFTRDFTWCSSLCDSTCIDVLASPLPPLGARRRHPKPTISDVLYTLSSAMSLLRRCRVNAAVTIQVFTHLFHYINMWIFNKLVLQPHHGLCSRAWGRKLRKRLARVESWAQKQGLELAADRHLSRIIQVSGNPFTPSSKSTFSQPS